jgi:predicted RNase H-like HicB family nuclease
LRAGGLTLDDVVKKSGMRIFTAVVERDPATGLLVGYVPAFSGAHSQAETLDELNANLREVIEMLLEDSAG